MDTVPRRPPYLHGAQKKKYKELKKELKHLDCIKNVASVTFDRLKGKDIEEESQYDEETERVIDGLEGEGESSTAYKTFKAYQETPGSALNGEYGWKLRDEAEEEIGMLNHKLRTGEWVQDVKDGKPFSIMDAMMKMDELRDSIRLMDRMSQYDTYHPIQPEELSQA